MDITNEEIQRVPLVLGDKSFKEVLKLAGKMKKQGVDIEKYPGKKDNQKPKKTNKRKIKFKQKMENTFVKKNVEENEFLFQNMVQRFLPKIFAYSRETKTLEMENLNGWMSVSDMFSEDVTEIPTEIFESIRYIIQVLFDNGIVYNDVTGSQSP